MTALITPAYPSADSQWVGLAQSHNAQLPGLEALDACYDGDQPLSYMHPELLRNLETRVRQVVINWPELIVDSLTSDWT